jgi:hypothetical protein
VKHLYLKLSQQNIYKFSIIFQDIERHGTESRFGERAHDKFQILKQSDLLKISRRKNLKAQKF